MNRDVHYIHRQRGMALFQVLLLTAVIAVLAIQFTQTAKNQVSIASTLGNRVQAGVDMRTAESQLLFALLTEQRYQHNAESLPIVNQWNFYGKPFSVNEKVEYVIQDQNGLIGLFRAKDTSLLASGFGAIGVQQPQTLAAGIIDWQDADSNINLGGAEQGQYASPGKPSNFPFQTYQEIAHVNGLFGKNWYDIRPFVSIRPQTYINPKLAPKELLALHLPAEQVAKVVELRENNQLTDSFFSSLTGLTTDEGVFFSASGLLRVSIKVKSDDVVFTNKLEFKVQPYDRHPFIEYEKTI